MQRKLKRSPMYGDKHVRAYFLKRGKRLFWIQVYIRPFFRICANGDDREIEWTILGSNLSESIEISGIPTIKHAMCVSHDAP